MSLKNPFLRTQKNAIFEAIQIAELDPQEFYWGEYKSENSPRKDNLSIALFHKPSDYYYAFNIDEDDGQHLPEFSPGEETIAILD